jgi:hypothetical protein
MTLHDGHEIKKGSIVRFKDIPEGHIFEVVNLETKNIFNGSKGSTILNGLDGEVVDTRTSNGSVVYDVRPLVDDGRSRAIMQINNYDLALEFIAANKIAHILRQDAF